MTSETNVKENFSQWLILGSILLFALVLRSGELFTEMMWSDEILTNYAAGQKTSEAPAWIARFTVHPPLYYMGVNLWTNLLGAGPIPLRVYSLLWSLLQIALVWGLVKHLLGAKAGIIAGILMAANPMHVLMAAEARMYMQASTMGLISSLLILKWLDEISPKRRGIILIAYSFAALGTIGSHYVAGSILFAHGILVLTHFYEKPMRLVSFTVAGLFVTTVFLFWIMYVFESKNGTLVGNDMDWLKLGLFPLPRLIFVIFNFPYDDYGILGATGSPTGGGNIPFSLAMLTAITITALLAMPAYQHGFKKLVNAPLTKDFLRIFILFVIPIAVMLFYSVIHQPVFYACRSGTFVLPYFIIILTFCAHSTLTSKYGKCGLGALFFIWMTSTGYALITKQKDDVAHRLATMDYQFNVDFSVTGKRGLMLFYRYSVPDSFNLTEREDLDDLLTQYEGKPFRLGIFTSSDERKEYAEWFRYHTMHKLILQSFNIDHVRISEGTHLILLDFDPEKESQSDLP